MIDTGRRLQHAAEQYVQLTQFGGTLGDLVLQASIEFADAGLGGLLRGDVAYGLRGADHAAVRTEDRRDGHRHVEQVTILVPAHGIEADHLFFTAMRARMSSSSFSLDGGTSRSTTRRPTACSSR